MRNNKLFIALAASLLISGNAMAAQGEQDWPAFNEIDIDDDGLISPAEIQQHEVLQEEIDEEGFLRRQEYEDIRAEHREEATGYPGPGIEERKADGAGGTGVGPESDTGTGGDAGGDAGSDSD